MVLHRPVNMGGFGLHNVRIKALASLIRTFLETAVNPKFQHNLFHSLLYRVNVLDDDSVPTQPLPPYYPVSFFNIIKQAKQNTPLNVATMSTADWYRLLVEQEITMYEPINSPWEYIRCRAEVASPNTDWVMSWRRARLKGLGTEAASFLWKLLHRLLPTEERLARILPNSSNNCKLCTTPTNADLHHCLFQCVSTVEVGTLLLSMVRLHDPAVTPHKLLRLEFNCDAEDEMPLVWVLSHTLLYMWSTRLGGKIVNRILTRAVIESKISILRETRFTDEHEIIKDLVEVNL